MEHHLTALLRACLLPGSSLAETGATRGLGVERAVHFKRQRLVLAAGSEFPLAFLPQAEPARLSLRVRSWWALLEPSEMYHRQLPHVKAEHPKNPTLKSSQ